MCYLKLRGLRLSYVTYCAGGVVLRLNDWYKDFVVGIVCESRNTFLACDSLLRAGKYRYMASVVTLACDEKGSAEFGCRWVPKGAHSRRLHGITAYTECICLFFVSEGTLHPWRVLWQVSSGEEAVFQVSQQCSLHQWSIGRGICQSVSDISWRISCVISGKHWIAKPEISGGSR